LARTTQLRPGRPEEVDMLPERIERARTMLESHAREGRTPAIAGLVARRGVVVLDAAYGDLRPGGPALTPDAIFPITSMTKPLTATLAMILVEDGLLSIGRPVREYIPELEGDGIDDVLIHHLLTHTSGWDDNRVFENLLKKVAADTMPELPPDAHPLHHGALAGGLDTPRETSPGETMIYCNFNYTLLGEVVERVSGKRFEEFARERLFGPLGMNDTDFVLRDDMRERVLVRPPGAPIKEEVLGLPGCDVSERRSLRRRAHLEPARGDGNDPQPDSRHRCDLHGLPRSRGRLRLRLDGAYVVRLEGPMRPDADRQLLPHGCRRQRLLDRPGERDDPGRPRGLHGLE